MGERKRTDFLTINNVENANKMQNKTVNGTSKTMMRNISFVPIASSKLYGFSHL